MAVLQISKIIIKSGLSTDLPNALSEGELGFATDTGELFIGAPNLSKISYREQTSTSDGIYPYQNVKLMTEFDFPKAITGDYYTQSPLMTVVIPNNSESTLMYSCDENLNTCFLNYSMVDSSGNMLGMGTIQASASGFTSSGNNIAGVAFNTTWVDNVLTIYCTNSGGSNITANMCAMIWDATN